MFNFFCYCGDRGNDFWSGEVEYIRGREGYYHISILSRSKIFMILGKTNEGIFACIPDSYAGCYLEPLHNIVYNVDTLTCAMKNRINAITIAVALDAIKNEVVL